MPCGLQEVDRPGWMEGDTVSHGGGRSGDPADILDPPNTTNNTWPFWTHTYDAATLAPFVGQDLTIEFGTNPTNTAPGRASWDNISLTAIPDSSALVLTILPGSETPGTFDFSWKGKAGKRYDPLPPPTSPCPSWIGRSTAPTLISPLLPSLTS